MTSNECRRLTDDEWRLVSALIEKGERATLTSLTIDREAPVVTMDDGGMGSLSFMSSKAGRIYGGDFAQITFMDADGVPVFVSLYLDRDGEVYELDMFKGDGNPLVGIPDPIVDVHS